MPFSRIVYRSRAHRDQVNKMVMKIPCIQKMKAQEMAFDMKRMCHGGFRAFVDL